MINTEIMMKRLRFALDSLDSEDQLKLVEIVEMFSAQINEKNIDKAHQTKSGVENE